MTDDPRIPSVTLVVTLEATPRLSIDAANDADRDALYAWVREARPDLDAFFRGIAREIHTKRQAA